MEGLDRLERAMQYLRTEVDAEMPAQQVVILLTVCKEEGITQHALGERLGMLGGSVSRNVKSLSQFAVRGASGNLELKGAGLLDTRPDQEYRLRMAVFLTPKGKEVIEQLNRIIGGTP